MSVDRARTNRTLNEASSNGAVVLEQARLLELVARGAALDECLAELCRAVSRLHPAVRACVLLADEQRQSIPHVVTTGTELAGFGDGIRGGLSTPITSTPAPGHPAVPLGTLFFCFAEPRGASDAERQLAELGARLATIAIERSRTDEALRRTQAQLEAELADIGLLQRLSGEMVLSHGTQEDLYEKVMDVAVQVMRSDFASMQMFFPERGAQGELLLLAHRGFNPDGVEYWKWVEIGTGSACAEAFRTGRRTMVVDVETCDFIRGDDLASHRDMGMRAVQTTPLFSSAGVLIGMISTHWKAPHEPSERDWRMFDVLARHAADLVERLRAEQTLSKQKQLYEGVLTTTPDLAYVFDLDHRFIYANQGLLNVWGKTWDEAIGRNCLELGYESWHAAMHDREIEQVVVTKQPIRGEVPFTGTFGRRIYDYIFTPVLGDHGEVVAIAGTTRDITDIRAAEEQLRLQADLLREGDRRKDEFLAMLAHELRNPLAPIRTGLELLRLGGERALDRVRPVLERQVTHMVRLIDDLLDVSRITSGRIQLERRPVPLAELVQMAVEANQAAIDAAGLTLSVDLSERACALDADPTRFVQVISNLLHNSTKFTEPGGRISIRAGIDEAVPGQLAMTVSDTGAGISASLLPRVFDLFVQGDGGAHGKGGLGIGLALARQLVEMHGGRIDGQSEGAGRGAAFTIRMPVLPWQPLQTAPAAQEPSAAISLRVLIVDDNVDAATTLSELVATLGGDVRTAHDGEAGLLHAASFHPDAILLDIGMPGIDGYETCRRLRLESHGKDVHVVALTGWGQDRDRERALGSGFDAHLTKPADPREVTSLLARIAAARK